MKYLYLIKFRLKRLTGFYPSQFEILSNIFHIKLLITLNIHRNLIKHKVFMAYTNGIYDVLFVFLFYMLLF